MYWGLLAQLITHYSIRHFTTFGFPSVTQERFSGPMTAERSADPHEEHSRAHWPDRSTQERSTHEWLGTTVRVDDVDLYYERHAGVGEASPPLICLHNFSSNSRKLFSPMLPVLRESFDCYLVDLRGHGRSNNPRSDWTHEQSSQDIIGFCRAMGIDQAFFFAASSGGMTMLRVARYAPKLVRAMVVDSATYRVPPEARMFYKPPEELSPKLKEYYREANEVLGPEYGQFLAKTFYDFRLPECDINVPLETLKEIEAPTLIVSGDRDFFFTVNIAIDMKLTIPNSELLVFPDTRHIVCQYHPEMTAQAGLHFLRKFL
jgi:non-heme chloroperoxidase